MGEASPNLSNAITEATVKDAKGNTNTLYGNDSPATGLDTPPTATWAVGYWERSDTFTDTLMYNPSPNASAGGPGGGSPEPSIWIPVGQLTWSWSATAGYVTSNNPNSLWIELAHSQTQGEYATTTQFPTWSANKQDASNGFSKWFSVP